MILHAILEGMKNVTYRASAELAREKGAFPLFDRDKYLEGLFIQALDPEVQELIHTHGIRNSHLLSVAPTGTISMAADNISSGIEPVYALRQRRLINYPGGVQEVELEDYGSRFLNVKGTTADECSAEDHLRVLITTSHQMDSAVSKTCNVRNDYPWEDFQQLYLAAYKNGCKGCTTHRTGNLRGAILSAVEDPPAETQAPSCELDPVTGVRSCE
jgi:ribonucleoside-diphosphate reductase alpha chain